MCLLRLYYSSRIFYIYNVMQLQAKNKNINKKIITQRKTNLT